MSWRDEFNERFAIPASLEQALIAKGFSDESWHNDVCPSFRKDATGGQFVVWCDDPNPYDRECEADTRYALCFEPSDLQVDDPNYKVIVATDSELELLLAIQKEAA